MKKKKILIKASLSHGKFSFRVTFKLLGRLLFLALLHQLLVS